MTPRPSRAGRSRDGLFWNPSTDAEITDNPRGRPCPWPPCRAGANEPCTVRRRGRAVPMTTYHDARKEPTT